MPATDAVPSVTARRRSSVSFVWVMSREMARSRSGRPPLSRMALRATSHHFGVPSVPGQCPTNRAARPWAAAFTASRTVSWKSGGHDSDHIEPRSRAKSRISSFRIPPAFIHSRRPSRSRTLMQSSLLSIMRLMNSSGSRSGSCCVSALLRSPSAAVGSNANVLTGLVAALITQPQSVPNRQARVARGSGRPVTSGPWEPLQRCIYCAQVRLFVGIRNHRDCPSPRPMMLSIASGPGPPKARATRQARYSRSSS